jgi:uncharacterized protein (TIGR02145 family)
MKTFYIGKKNLCRFPIWIIFLISSWHCNAQLSISAEGGAADPSAMVEVRSTQKGFLTPRMTTIQRDAIVSPAEGLMIYNLDKKWMEVFDGTAWNAIEGGWRCGLSQVEDAEGNLYNTVQIGIQCWMAENLNTGTKIDSVTDPSDNATIEKRCYNDLDARCNIFGALYTWNEMMDYSTTEGTRGICPIDWHIPTHDEWTVLAEYLGGNSVAGGPMKTTGFYEYETGYWYSPNTGATNASGFTGLPSGYHNDGNSTFYNLHVYGYFWSSTLYSANPDIYARAVRLYAGSAAMEQTATNFRVDAYPVRCVKNQ